MRTYYSNEILTNNDIARILNAHYIDTYTDSNNNIWAKNQEFTLVNGKWELNKDLNVTGYTVKKLRELLGY